MHPTERTAEKGQIWAAQFTTKQHLMVFLTEVMSAAIEKKQPSPQKETRKYKSKREKEIKLSPCELITHKQPHLQAGAGTASRAQLGQGQGDRKQLMPSCEYGNTGTWKPHPGVQHSSFFIVYQGHFNKLVFYGAPSTLLVVEIPDCIPFPSTLQHYFTAILLLCLTSGQTPEIVKLDGERDINLSYTLGKINLWWDAKHGWSTSLHLATEELCTRECVWPVLLH